VVKDWIGFHPSESARISNVVPEIINILQNSLQNLWIFHESQGVNSYDADAALQKCEDIIDTLQKMQKRLLLAKKN